LRPLVPMKTKQSNTGMGENRKTSKGACCCCCYCCIVFFFSFNRSLLSLDASTLFLSWLQPHQNQKTDAMRETRRTMRPIPQMQSAARTTPFMIGALSNCKGAINHAMIG
jgi:hypothetical protein